MQAQNLIFKELYLKAVEKERKDVPSVMAWREGIRPTNSPIPASYPSSAVGMISVCTVPQGTAFVVGPKHIMTCASLCADPSKISFTPWSAISDSFQKHQARKVYLSQRWKPDQNEPFSNYDFAVVELQTTENLEQKYGSFGYDFDWLPQKGKSVPFNETTIIGFSGTSLKRLQGRFVLENGTLISQVEANSLSNGSPILQVIDGEYFVRGIHVNHSQPVLVDNNMLQIINQWLPQTTLSIKLSEKNIGSAGLNYLVHYMRTERNEQLSWLKQVNLYRNKIGDQGCLYLKQANWKNLQRLNLACNMISSEGCRHIKEADWPNLLELDLWINSVGAEGCQHLKDAQWPNLQYLDLRSNDIGAQGCQQLKGAQWTNLQLLNLRFNHIGADGCKHLAEWQWHKLQYLNISYNQIGAEGCRSLKQAQWPNLQRLYLTNNQINSEGCRQFKEAPWPNLRLLDLSGNKIEKVDRKQLVGRFETVYS